ncbi:hypothetical protein [Streptomyces acidiscabies]|uniref:Uncharacterized protein n=1 Tax=Streptomyces acidiscabies TaxID=42234 RepID=A0AAP6BDB2_9ACTN|nr:hypothetical protein [Streptomyces acidiscabies]MBZ3917659.1 hypothetical protein [Streptomyces acidiscabies]MDX2962654.1 hypothetical protein [Streptomyces acidiscabies]MDX3025999.1 hypothetical protein [Streptomyces acidiscabies]MDX3796938.1 hypothetical protein [Streptomyces acidiscabies]
MDGVVAAVPVRLVIQAVRLGGTPSAKIFTPMASSSRGSAERGRRSSSSPLRTSAAEPPMGAGSSSTLTRAWSSPAVRRSAYAVQLSVLRPPKRVSALGDRRGGEDGPAAGQDEGGGETRVVPPHHPYKYRLPREGRRLRSRTARSPPRRR